VRVAHPESYPKYPRFAKLANFSWEMKVSKRPRLLGDCLICNERIKSTHKPYFIVMKPNSYIKKRIHFGCTSFESFNKIMVLGAVVKLNSFGRVIRLGDKAYAFGKV
jgi:hypothetical protein